MKKQMTEKLNTNKGITLIALVITIIVMLILVAVTISMAVNGGLFDYAGKATADTNNAMQVEQQLASGKVTIDNTEYNSINEYLNQTKKEYISAKDSYVGYYADIDGNKQVDGVIYADLAVGGSGDPESKYGSYTIETKSGLKNYYVSQTKYDGIFGEKDVLTPSGTGNDRFYVMALTDLGANGEKFCWYYSMDQWLSSDELETASEFGKGKNNTEIMVNHWQNADYGEKNADATYKDVWGQIPSGWFLPSQEEWSAFIDVWDIDKNTYINYGLKERYWTSTQFEFSGDHPCGAYNPYFTAYPWDCMFSSMGPYGNSEFSLNMYVRLSTTF